MEQEFIFLSSIFLSAKIRAFCENTFVGGEYAALECGGLTPLWIFADVGQ